MGLLDNTTQQEYYNSDNHGDYQFVSLEDIINQFMFIYVGEEKIISKARRMDVAFHAQRALQEFSFDTFKSIKSQEITLPPSLTINLPQDYINYTRIAWSDDAGVYHRMYPTRMSSNPQKILQNDDGSYYSNLITNGDFINGISGWEFWNVVSYSNVATAGYNDTQINWSVDSDGVYLTTNGIGGSQYPKFRQYVELEDGEEYTLSYNITNISDNALTGSDVKIIVYGAGASSYKPVNTALSTTGVKTHTFSFDSSNNDDAKGVYITFQLSDAHEYVKSIGVKDVFLVKTKNDGNYDLAPTGTINSEDISTAWTNYKATIPEENTANDFDYDDDVYDLNIGQRYGIDPQYAHVNGSFFIDEVKGKIHFSSNTNGKNIILEYISDGLGTEEEMKVHKFAEEAMYKHIAHSILSTRVNIPEYIVQRFKKEKFAAKRVAKLRLSNLKIEEITQVLRGKSKHIKH